MTAPWLDGLLSARVYDLEQPRFAGMPIHPVHRPGYFYALHRRHRDTHDPAAHGPRSSASGVLTLMEHTGTHRAKISISVGFYTSASGRNGEPVAPCNFSGMPTNAKRYCRSRARASRLRFSMM